ncbi:MAG: Fe-S cluster assembly protein NifU [Mailhella sp.]|nr:Fe-S cluster assembly protein NifU [Mailhella sp.]
MWEYTDTVRDHFLNPRNAGEMLDANAIGEVGSLACGDALKLFLKINEKGVIEDASFQTFGCASAIASSSALTELIKGKTVEEASKITNKDIANYLGGLPKEKMHCSVMGEEALEAAIRNYKGLPPLSHEEEGKLVCKCFGITDNQIIKAIRENNLQTVEEVTNFTKAGGACGTCLDAIAQILEVEKNAGLALQELKPVTKKPLSNIQKMQKIIQVIEEDIRPRLTQDGGDIELVDVVDNKVFVSLRGACSSCRASAVTLKDVVESTLKEHVDENITVVQA